MTEAPRNLQITTSRDFLSWLKTEELSLVFTTYQAGKLFFLGLRPGERLSIFERTFERAMGLAVSGDAVYLSTVYQLWRFHNALKPGQEFQGYDRLFIPKESRVTGNLDIHDMAIESSGRLVFVNTLFNCVATIDDHHSFRPVWRPPWITALVPEDRCHLNGLALRNGRLRYCTAASRSDVSDGWRDHQTHSGILVDTQTNEVLCEGLSMPHSPRWHQGHVHLLNSGTGYLGRIHPERREFEPICFLPGYARGMAIHKNWAVVGLSNRREGHSAQELPMDQTLKDKRAKLRCGLQIVDLETGAAPHWLRIEGVVQELYDVAVLPQAVRPMAVGFKTDEIARMISFDGAL